MQYHDWKPELAPTQVLKDDLLNHRITWPQYQNGYDKVGYGKVKGYDELIAERPEAQQPLNHRQ